MNDKYVNILERLPCVWTNRMDKDDGKSATSSTTHFYYSVIAVSPV